jgi:hypothetical protein
VPCLNISACAQKIALAHAAARLVIIKHNAIVLQDNLFCSVALNLFKATLTD